MRPRCRFGELHLVVALGHRQAGLDAAEADHRRGVFASQVVVASGLEVCRGAHLGAPQVPHQLADLLD